MKNLSMMMMLASVLFLSCKKDQNETPDNTLAIRMSNELIASINNNEVASEEVLKYFAKGNPVVTDKEVPLKVGGQTRILQADQKFAVTVTAADSAQTESVQGKSKPWKDCRYTVLVQDYGDHINYLPISNSPGCPDLPKFSIDVVN